MAKEEPEYERRSVERLIFFSDAVVAIAITLLAIGLPTLLLLTIAVAVMIALVRHINARDLRADDRPASADGAGRRARTRPRDLRPDPGPGPEAGAPRATLIYLYGPPASGKLTVAEQLSELTGIPLFHNHLTVNAIRPIFGFGTPAFTEASWAMRWAVFEAAARAGHSLIFTNNSAWSGPDPRARFEEAAETTRRIMAEHGGRTLFVRLTASPAALAARVADESRQAHRKLVDAGRLRELLASFDAAPLHPDDLLIDTERTTPAEAARAIAAALG